MVITAKANSLHVDMYCLKMISARNLACAREVIQKSLRKLENGGLL